MEPSGEVILGIDGTTAVRRHRSSPKLENNACNYRSIDVGSIVDIRDTISGRTESDDVCHMNKLIGFKLEGYYRR